jgi:hypothetical protein
MRGTLVAINERTLEMTEAGLPAWWPASLLDAITFVETAGATGTARSVVTGLLQVAGNPTKLAEAVAILTNRLPGDAPIWHITQAAQSHDPIPALADIRDDLDRAVPQSVATAVRWVTEHGGRVAVAPSSSVVAEVLSQLGEQATQGEPLAGLAGADAISSTEVLNITGTYELARRLPTLVVTTSLKLVPDTVFARLDEPFFERIPLSAFAGVVLDGEIVDPTTAGRRAAALKA